jgi:tetratricopeptide (TPR) repeat protein
MSNILRIALCILVAGLTVVLPEMLAAQAQTKSPIGEASNRATELFNAGKYGEAVPLALRALTLTKAKYPPGHAEVIQATHNLAMIYRFNDQSAEAEKLFRENLAINEKKNGPRHKETGLSVLNVAETLRDQGKYGEAETFYKRALAILEKTGAPQDTDLSAAISGLASLYQTQ